MRRSWWTLPFAFALLCAVSEGTPAQERSVLLQIRPHPGDTIRVRLDQTVEMAAIATGKDSTRGVESGTLVVLSTLAVESVDREGATITSITDSVRLSAPPSSASAAVLGWAASTEHRAVRFRVAADGSVSVPGTRGPLPAGTVAAHLPATLPVEPIKPGSSWESRMQVPLASSVDPGGVATLSATFTFDSLSASGELAFLSLHGKVSKQTDSPPPGGETRVVETAGTVTGQILVDRRRGWITEARTAFVLQSLVVSEGNRKPPMRVRMTISQWLRAM